MIKISQLTRQDLAFFLLLVFPIALLFSKFVLTLVMIALIAVAFFEIQPQKSPYVSINPRLISNVKWLFEYRSYAMVLIIFLLTLIGGLYSTDLSYWGERVRIRLPYLILPIAFAGIPPLGDKRYFQILAFSFLIVFLTAIGVFINYLLHFEAINDLLSKGQTVPTPINHIRFSLLVAFMIIVGGVLYLEKKEWLVSWEKRFYLISSVFLFLFIHVLSVRSGLAVLYATLFFLILRYIVRKRKYLIGIGAIVLMALLPFIAYQVVPSFKSKIDYTLWDLKMFREGKGASYSDSERWISLSVGWQIAQENPIFGIGVGDLRQRVETIFQEQYPKVKKPKMPHNQLLSVWAASGLVGLIFFLFAFFYPLFYKKSYHHLLFFALHIIIFVSFVMENTIENAIGAALHSMFLLLMINHLSGKEAEEV
jgi:O-antigen ligase